MFFVYVLRSDLNGWFYVEMSENVESRLTQHNKGMTKSTKPYRPWRLFFIETLSTREEARKREVDLKSGVGKEYIKRRWSGSSVG
jgi:putative endonuclease